MCPQEAFGSSTQPEFVRRQLAIAVAIGQSGHGIDSADADADAAEDGDGNGDNDSEDDNDKCFPWIDNHNCTQFWISFHVIKQVQIVMR